MPSRELTHTTFVDVDGRFECHTAESRLHGANVGFPNGSSANQRSTVGFHTRKMVRRAAIHGEATKATRGELGCNIYAEK